MSRERTLPRLLGLVPVLCLLHAGCAEEQRSMYRGRPSDGGTEVNLDGGGGTDLQVAADLTMNTEGASIKILEPMAGSLIKTPRLLVVAQVTKGGGTEVTAVQTRIAGQMKAVQMTLRAGTTDKYEAELDLSALRTGPVGILVDAQNTKMITNTVQVTATYDAGPMLTVREPSGMSYRGSAPVVIDTRGENSLQGGSIKSVTATVQGVQIMLTHDKASDYLWTSTGTIAFQAREFPVPLTGVQVMRVEATNNNDVTTALERPFTIDEEGPEIEFVSPKPGDIVGGVINLTVKVTDASGVNDSSVVAVWLNDPAKFSVALTRVPGSDNFTARFDTRRLPEPLSLIYPSLSIRARDRLGNQASRGEVLILDNTSPVMALDPPNTQIRVKDTQLPSGFKCSISFNPVGTHHALLQDGTVFGQIVTVRARVTERGNSAMGLAIEHISGIDPSTVEMLATPIVLGGAVPSPPLVVDADGKGTCTNLNPLLQPTSTMTASNQALVLRMANITTVGTPVYGDDLRPPFPAMPKLCDKPKDGSEADPLCRLAEGGFTFALPTLHGSDPTEIWTIGPVTNRECAGLQLDSLNVLPQGPYCVAVRAADRAGNRNVSKPLRICIERPVGSGACNVFRQAVMNGTLPSCRGRYDPVTQTATTGPDQQCTLDPTTPYPRPQEPYIIQ